MCLNKRYMARIILEAETPLKVGSGERDILFDSPVFTDANGLPQIPGTSLAGILRHSLRASGCTEKAVDSVFGFQKTEGDKAKDSGEGSRLIVSAAFLMTGKQTVVEGLADTELLNTSFIKEFSRLPSRDHCRIDHTGAADTKTKGKFDETVVPKGARFKFELEFLSCETDKDDNTYWRSILDIIRHPAFRIGGGTGNGFGKMKILSLQTRTYELSNKSDLDAYLKCSTSLCLDPDGFKDETGKDIAFSGWQVYQLTLKPENVFLFGSGLEDEDANMTPKYEKIIEWKGDTPRFTKKQILIPASSIKGALSHRVAFHYNRLSGVFSDHIGSEEFKKNTGENNEAVKTLFGTAKESSKDRGSRGNVILHDIFLSDTGNTKIFNHVAIDRFTGGARRGALFNEKVISQPGEISLNIQVKYDALNDKKIKEAFKCALDDITDGLLPLGGSVMRGHGVFTGKWKAVGVQEIGGEHV